MSLAYAPIELNETSNKNKSINTNKISSLLSAIHDNMNDNDLCTYNKALYYVGKKRTSCDPEIVWNHIVDFVTWTMCTISELD